jgi:hypothetical protein
VKKKDNHAFPGNIEKRKRKIRNIKVKRRKGTKKITKNK